MRGKARLGAICLALFLSLAQAGPVSRASRMLSAERLNVEPISDDMIDDDQPTENINNNATGGCIVGSKILLFGEPAPSANNCETCVCTEKGVQCTSIICEVREGCKVLHRADHCCPLYQCECEHNGVTYSNGDKLMDPDNPCQVCYCQGGEIVCNPIACFRRDDCEPRYVAGRCCPEYDHCPPRDKVSSDSIVDKIEPQKVFESIPKVNSSEDVNPENEIWNISNGDINNAITPSSDVFPTPSKPIILSMNGSNNVKIVSTLNIKEVTGSDLALNNEIRIKEILPVINNEFTISDPTKSPTFPREVSYVEKNSKDDTSENKIPVIEPKEENKEGYQTPPVLRIGDQLLYLNEDGIIEDNSTMNTPAPVFTVIGAEGLQRGVEEPEEIYESKDKDEILNEENLKEVINIYEQLNNDKTSDPNVSNEYIQLNQKGDGTESSSEQPRQQSSLDSNAFSTEDSISVFTTESPTPESDSSGSGELLPTGETEVIKSVYIEDELPAGPSEHVPDHNPEYPPIPEDIMIFSMTEDPSDIIPVETDYSSSTSSTPNYDEIDERINRIVKRPAFSGSPISNSINKKELKESERIIPEVLHIVRANKTNSTGNSNAVVPEEWLKGKEKQDGKGSQLPDTVLLPTSFSNSKEDDDSKDYIFFNTSEVSEPTKIEIFTNEPDVVTEMTKTSTNVRSPGEPLLIPEWEREMITTEIPDYPSVSSNTEDILHDNNDTPETFSSEVENIETTTDGTILLKNVDIGKSQQLNAITKINDDEDFDQKYAFTEDPVTNLVISTENPSNTPSTKASPIEKSVIHSGNDNINADEDFIFFDLSSATKKQKKGGEVRNESEKKGNILADLISLVGDVANIDTHDVEVSTVHNSLEVEKYSMPTKNPNRDVTIGKVTNPPTSPELSEFTTENSGDIPLEHETVELTTKKTYIDQDSDERISWKSTDYIKKDIEIIPKVENNKTSPSLEKIVERQQIPNKISNKQPVSTSTKNSEQTPKPIIRTKLNPLNVKENPKSFINTTNDEKLITKLQEILSTDMSETTESSEMTVMKVSSPKSDINVQDTQDKLTKREIDSQLRDSDGRINESLISIFREFLERQYRH